MKKGQAFPRLQKTALKKMDEFEYLMPVLKTDGQHFALLVTVYDYDHFDIWNLDLNLPVDIHALPSLDQQKIEITVLQRLDGKWNEATACDRSSASFFDNPEPEERGAEIREMNAMRGIKS